MRPRCANISYSHSKHIIGPRLDIPRIFNIPLIDRILLRNIPNILKDNSVLRVVRDEASHLMSASFFPSQGHVYAILNRQTGVRQQLCPYGRRPYATDYHLQVGYKRSRIYIPNAAVQLSRSPRSIMLGPLVREQILIVHYF